MKEGNESPSKFPTGKAFEKPEDQAFADDNERGHWVINTVSKMDPGLFPNFRAFQLTCVLVASSIIGPDAERIAKMLDYSYELVSGWARNLEKSGVWQNGKVRDEGWFHPQSGYVGLILHSLVADGLIEMLEDPQGGWPKYRPIPGSYVLALSLLTPELDSRDN